MPRDEILASGRPVNVTVLAATLAIGGAEQLLLQLLEAIDKRRFNMRVSLLKEPGPIGKAVASLGIPVTAGLQRPVDLALIPRLARHLRSTKTEILLLINHRNTLFYGIPAARLAGVRAVINWQNETYRRYTLHRLTMLGRRLFLSAADRIVAASAGHADYIAATEGIPLSKIDVIHNAVNPEALRSSLSRPQARERLGLPAGNCPVISMIAVLRQDKAHDILLQATKLLLKTHPSLHVLIVGDGPQKQYLLRTAHTLGIERNVHFLGFRRDIGDILRAIDINVLSTRPKQETLSVAVIEAMAAGLPNVVTDVGFLREVVRPGETGFLVGEGNAAELAEKIDILLRDEELRARLGRRAQAIVEETLTVWRMAESFGNLFEELTGKRQCAA